MGSEIRARAIVEKDKKFESGVISLRGDPIGDLIAIAAFVDHDILAADFRHALAVTSFYSNKHVRWCPWRTCILGINTAGEGSNRIKPSIALSW